MKALHRKALRDLWRMRGQALAIALVIASGIAMLVMAQATLLSLRDTRDAFYRETRFSEVWVQAKRVPQTMLARLAEIPGVAEVEARLVTGAKLSLDGFAEPAEALVQSLPDDGVPRQNRLLLQSGRLPAPGSTREVLIGTAFAKAHGLQAGDTLQAIIYGRQQRFTIVGTATSAEHLYLISPGAMFPDDLRYTVLWLPERALAAALNMKGAFNEATFRLAPGADAQTVIAAIDRLLARYGTTGATDRMEQVSHRMLHEEFRQLATLTWMFPTIFLAVAAFLLNMVFKRLISMQRDQVAILKAFGYRTAQVAAHYGLIVSLICFVGIVLGTAAGVWMGRNLAALYQINFHFPYLQFRLDPQTVAVGAVVSLLAALLGSGRAVYIAAREPVAQAMRPPAPDRFRRTLLERLGIARHFSQPTRMIWRQLERRPGKALFAIIALAAAGGIVVVGNFQRGSVNYMIGVENYLAQQHDISVSFIEDAPPRALYELAAMRGVRAAEGQRSVAVRVSHDNRQKRLILEGISEHSQMRHLMRADLRPQPLQTGGIILGDYFADWLGVRVGDRVWVEILDGRGKTVQVPVVQTVYTLSGNSAYMTLPTLNRLLGDERINGALLTADTEAVNRIQRELNDRPRVMAASTRRGAIHAFRDMIARVGGTFSIIAVFMGMIVNIGVVYNTMRMALSERSRELASLRVLGFSHGEVRYILLGEMHILVLASLPLGIACGYSLIYGLAQGLQNDIYRMPVIIAPAAYAIATLTTLASAALSALVIARQLRRLDLIEVLKTRE